MFDVCLGDTKAMLGSSFGYTASSFFFLQRGDDQTVLELSLLISHSATSIDAEISLFTEH